MGFGIMASVVTNNVAALAALANGMLPLAEDRPDRGRTTAQAGDEASLCAGKKSCTSAASGDRSTTDRARRSHSEFSRRRHEIPVPTELHWHADKPQFTIRSNWLSFIVGFTPDRLVVDAELSLAAKMLATDENRKHAVAVHRLDRQRSGPLTPEPKHPEQERPRRPESQPQPPRPSRSSLRTRVARRARRQA